MTARPHRNNRSAMTEPREARADLVTGVILFALSAAVIVGAWNMDRLEIRRIHPFSAPGVTPGLLGIALGIASFIMIVQSVRRGGLAGGWAAGAPRQAVIRLVVAAALALVYALGLIGNMPYWLATALFVTVFITVFEWGDGGNRAVRLAWAAGIGIATGLTVAYVFSELFLVRLP